MHHCRKAHKNIKGPHNILIESPCRICTRIPGTNKSSDLKSYKLQFSSCLSAQMTIAEFDANGINQ